MSSHDGLKRLIGAERAREIALPVWARMEPAASAIAPWQPGRVDERGQVASGGPGAPSGGGRDGDEPRQTAPLIRDAVEDDELGGEGVLVPPGMVLIGEDELARRDEALLVALREPMLEAVERFARALDEIEQRLRDDVVDLSARIASALVHRALKIDREIALEIAQRALRLLGPVERVVVKCAEVDAELLRERLPALARAEAGRAIEVIVRPSDDLTPGGVLLTFDGGVVDAREERRLARIVEAVKVAVQEHDVAETGA